jgi:hypothetical protein
MIDSFDLYNSFRSVSNTFTGGWFRLQTDFIVSVNDISNELWELWTAQAEKSQEIKDNLFPFLVSKNLIVKAQNINYGTFLPPPDYGRYASARVLHVNEHCVPSMEVDKGKCSNGKFKSDADLAKDYYDNVTEVDVEMIDNQRWGSVLKHLTKKPSLNRPKINQINNGFRVAPREVSVTVFYYYTRPLPATFLYTIAPGNTDTGAGDDLIYNKAQSTPLQWPSTVVNEFVWRLGERYGVFTRQEFMATYSGQKIKDIG